MVLQERRDSIRLRSSAERVAAWPPLLLVPLVSSWLPLIFWNASSSP